MSLSPREWLEERVTTRECGHDFRRRIRRLLAEVDRGEVSDPAQEVGKLYDEFRRAVAEAEE